MDDRKDARWLQDRRHRNQARKIELVDKNIDRANRIILADPIFQALRKQRALLSIGALNEAPHSILPRTTARESHSEAFSHSLEHALRSANLRSAPPQ